MPSSDRPTPPDAVAAGPGKGRPTPKRREREAARKRPLVPNDRRAAAKSQRAAVKAARRRQHEAMQTGDERHLPARDKGPRRRFVRDVVDARRNLGEYFLPFSLVMVFAVLLSGQNITAALVTILVLYTGVLATIVDGFLLSRLLKRRLREKFDGEIPRGTVMYGVVRGFQIRRSRLPRPMVERGQHPA